MSNREAISNMKGNYLIRNPYTKGNKKTLPFDVLGISFDEKYPVEVKTVEYKGWKRNVVYSNYTIESVMQIINGAKKVN